MGCCISTPRVEGDAGNLPASSSARAIIPHPPNSHDRPSTQASHRSHHRPRVPRDRERDSDPERDPAFFNHVNKPLKPHVWHIRRNGHPWTRSNLDAERRDFFDTRVTGRAEVWQALHAALELLYDGGERDEGLATAQEILNAAGISLPTGDLSNGAYDAWGNFYQIPEHVASDPTNLRAESHNEDGSKDEEDGDKSEDSEGLSDETLRRREAKGKGVLDPNDSFVFRARRSDGVAGDLSIHVSMRDTVKMVARRLKVKAALQPAQQVRISFLGKMLDEKKTLAEEGWSDKYVVNAYIS